MSNNRKLFVSQINNEFPHEVRNYEKVLPSFSFLRILSYVHFSKIFSIFNLKVFLVRKNLLKLKCKSNLTEIFKNCCRRYLYLWCPINYMYDYRGLHARYIERESDIPRIIRCRITTIPPARRSWSSCYRQVTDGLC